jgi:hypothetical protein
MIVAMARFRLVFAADAGSPGAARARACAAKKAFTTTT